ncbi:MAG: hypothetical protein ACJAT7_001675 [Psychromonas sp.]|jgi:hypothetical protein|uniref:hypothetical protein n=1 Tax=Psychromonas sp. TaxID=1884585 RepID=UPI0039E533EB
MNKKHFVLGGDIKKSLTEGYRFDLKSLFKDAFVITRKHYFPLITACLFTIIILAGSYSLILKDPASFDETGTMLINYVIALLIAPPLLTGLQMMGVNHAIGLKSKSIDLFNYVKIIVKLSLATMIISLITNIISVVLVQVMGDWGLGLSVVVLLYLNMTFCLVYPLIAEKKMPPQMALRVSFKLVNKNLAQFTILFILLALLFVAALIPSGLGMFLFVPFYFNLMGIVYRQTCGVGVVAMETSEGDQPPSDAFDA